jgi:segregation and condensation protein B
MSDLERSEDTSGNLEPGETADDAVPVSPGEPVALGEVDGLVPVLEALLFAAGDPVTLEEMQSAVPKEDRAQVEPALQLLCSAYGEDRGVQIVPLAGGYRMVTRSGYDRYIRALLSQRNRRRLGRASLESLAIVAYRQPITGPEISEIRGKDSAGVLKSLLDKRLLRITGRKRVVGKPFLYGTTREFLLHFGLNSLEDLPDMSEFEQMLQERMALLEEVPLPGMEEVPDEFAAAPMEGGSESETEDVGEAAADAVDGNGEPRLQEGAESLAMETLDGGDQTEGLEE